MTEFIGAGEKIIHKYLIDSGISIDYIYPQYPLWRLLDPEWCSDRDMKHLVDFYVEPDNIIRVQGKDHKHSLKGKRDDQQKRVLEYNGYKVIDVNYDDCPHLFTDEISAESKKEFDKFIGKYLRHLF